MTHRDQIPTGRSAGVALLAIMLSLGGCAAFAKQDRDELLAAGFKQTPAETPQYGQALPAHTFTHRSIGGADTVLYSDPTGCRCVYAGTEHDYQKYFDELESERAHSGGP